MLLNFHAKYIVIVQNMSIAHPHKGKQRYTEIMKSRFMAKSQQFSDFAAK